MIDVLGVKYNLKSNMNMKYFYMALNSVSWSTFKLTTSTINNFPNINFTCSTFNGLAMVASSNKSDYLFSSQ